MYQALCASSRCRFGPEGYLDPRPAADGLALCLMCRDRLGRDALLTAVRYADLALVLAGGVRSRGERVTSRGRDRSIPLNTAAVEIRTIIRHTLVALSQMIAEERGFLLPVDDVPAMARYVARSADWLSAHPAAAEHSAELGDLVHGRTRAVAYPGATSRFSLGVTCPESVLDETGALSGCPGTLGAVLRHSGGLKTSEVACDHDGTHAWPPWRWATLAGEVAA